MKKVLALITAAVLVFSLAACGAKKEEPADKPAEEPKAEQQEEKKEEPAEKPEEKPAEEPAGQVISGVPNPVTEYDSLEKLNDACGTSLTGPGVMGKSDEKFVSVKAGDYTVAEYDFSVAGHDFALRTAPTTDDISGVYGENGSAFEGTDASEEVVKCGEFLLYRWFNIGGQYVLSAKAEGLDEETFKGMAEEVKMVNSVSNSGVPGDVNYDTLAGEYSDKVSQRAMATVEGLEDGAKIEVRWGNSASETMVWTMTASFGEDGLLNYKDCRCVKETADADGKTAEEEVYKDGEGFFALGENGDLEWTGAADENCAECVFERMPE